MKHSIKNILSLCMVLIIILCSAMSLTSCMTSENNEHAEKMTKELVDYLIEDDYKPAYDMFRQHITGDDFRAGYNVIVDYFEGIKSYELKPVGWHIYTENGVSTYSVTYRMTADNGTVLLLESTFLTENDHFVAFQVSPSTMPSTSQILPLQILFIFGSLMIFGFTVWAFIDCIIRKIKLKALWLVIILVGFSLTLTFGQSLGINFALAIIFPLSKIASDGFTMSMTFALPVGAIVYLIICRKLPKKLPPAPPAEPIISETVIQNNSEIKPEENNEPNSSPKSPNEEATPNSSDTVEKSEAENETKE